MENLGVFTDTRTLRLQRRLPAPAAEVWRYLVEPERTALWRWRSEIEPRVGGAVTMRPGDGAPEHGPTSGVVTAWAPEQRFAYAWPAHATKVAKDEVSFELAPAGAATDLALTHALSPFASWMVADWHAGLDALVAALSGADAASVAAARAPSPELGEAYAEAHRQARATRPGVYMQDLFHGTPFHAHLGLEMTEVTADRVSVRVRKTGDLTLVGGSLHGGVVAAAVDALGAFHAGMAGQRRLAKEGDKSDARPFSLRTIGLNLDYLKPLRGETFTATTTVLDVGAHVIRVRGDVVSDQGVTVATGTVSFAY